MKNLTWQNPEQLFVAQELINKVKSKCCGIKDKLIGYKNYVLFLQFIRRLSLYDINTFLLGKEYENQSLRMKE